MLSKFNSIETRLRQWGASKRQLPDHNQEIKTTILSQYQNLPVTSQDRNLTKKPWLSILFFGSSVIAASYLLTVNPWKSPSPFSSSNTEHKQSLNAEHSDDNYPVTSNTSPFLSFGKNNKQELARPANSLGSTQAPPPSAGVDGTTSLPNPIYTPAPVPNPTPSPIQLEPINLNPKRYSIPVQPAPISSNLPIIDNREFLKLYYSAQIRSRQISEDAQNLAVMIRGNSGRIDSINTSKKYGFIQFAVPKSKLPELREQIKRIGGVKLVTENMSSQNLLGQKQAIETDQKNIDNKLTQLSNQSAQINNTHRIVVQKIEGQINTLSTQIAQLQTDIANNRGDISQLRILLSSYESQKQDLINKLNTENTEFALARSNLSNATTQTKNEDQNNKDKNLNLDANVETVEGTLTFTWISWFELLNIYTYGWWIPGLLILATLITFFIHRKKNTEKFEPNPAYNT